MPTPTDPPETNWGPGDEWSEDPRTKDLLRDNERLRAVLGRVDGYSVQLQRLIEHYCRGADLTPFVSTCPHHANMLERHKAGED